MIKPATDNWWLITEVKIGIDISQIAYEGTGVATYTRCLVEAIVKLNREDNFVLFGSSLRNKKPIVEFVKNLEAKNAKKKLSFFPPKLLEFLWNGIHVLPVETITGPLDVFHSSDWLEPPTRAAKRVTTVHDLAVFKYPETFSKRGGHDIVKNQKRKLFFVKRHSDLVIAVSETTKKDLVEILKIPEKRIRVVYEAAEPVYYPRGKEQANETKKKFAIEGDYLLCVGTREPRKNLERVIRAFAEITAGNKEISLVIAGKYGWGEDFGGDQLSVIGNRIKLLGFVEKEELARLYSGAKAFLYPSLYEGFGLPIVEAMSCGTPVITSEVGSMKEIAEGVGLLVNPQSVESIAGAISKITRSEKLREELKVKSLKRAGDFSWEKAALQTMEIYRQVAS
ncbi:glycosyltransferase family 1 protein [Candidatus Microgenomates bacterium]|nr:MAG: glycosyltransferase family 1 protein [Candidatus Microgenomates bacterium]